MRGYYKSKRTSGRKMSRCRRKRYGKKGLRLIPAVALLLLAAVIMAGVFLVKQGSGKKEVSLPLESSREVIPESLPEELLKAEGQAETRSIKAGGSAKEMLAQMTLNEKVAQMFVITPEALTGVERVYSAGKVTKEALERYPVGGLIYASGNLESSDQVKTMLDHVKSYSIGRMGVPVFTGIAGENGDFFSQSEDKDRYLSELGFNLGFVKAASEPVPRESLLGTGKAAAEEVKAFEEVGVKAVLEHFPGYGAAGENKKDGYAYTDKGLGDLLAGELIPFQAGIDAGVDFIMVGHIAAPQVTGDNTPSSLSEIMISDVLRNGMGYEGIVMTESLSASVITRNYSSAEAAVEAVKAGADLLVLPADFEAAYEGVLEAVKTGKIPVERIDRSLERILSVKISLNQ